ncbi:type II toxin-antitoxin system RelE/ParE family toxin [Photorhabdus sp. JAR]|nr:type II toxin-antitoxin system RelE/ParE family toxin [Photorhabdus luminescens]MCW7761304.1 type II toxin-antitoxin system RelE/ParE family toxin [Photorhabdus luminescens subsp. venezuelensis]
MRAFRLISPPALGEGLRRFLLKGDRVGIWSITVRANWRITFEFKNGDAYILNLEDYH